MAIFGLPISWNAYVISRHVSRYTCRKYIVLYGYKFFLTNCVGLKIRKKIKIFTIFAFLLFLAPYKSSKTVL